MTKDRRTKNTAGAMIRRAMHRIDRIHDKIDRRTKEGKNDAIIGNYKMTKDGARVWSF